MKMPGHVTGVLTPLLELHWDEHPCSTPLLYDAGEQQQQQLMTLWQLVEMMLVGQAVV
jgi:hypothetical protein